MRKSSLADFQFYQYLYVGKQGMYLQLREKDLTAGDMSFTYIKNESLPRIKPWFTPQDTDAGLEKLFPNSIWKDLLDK